MFDGEEEEDILPILLTDLESLAENTVLRAEVNDFGYGTGASIRGDGKRQVLSLIEVSSYYQDLCKSNKRRLLPCLRAQLEVIFPIHTLSLPTSQS